MAHDSEYRHARADDLPAVGQIFLAAFPESVHFYTGKPIPVQVVADLFAICLDAEPAAFFVATMHGQVSGYAFAPAHFSRLTRTALLHGHWRHMLWRWVNGQYQIGLRPVFTAARNWLTILRESRHHELSSDARILSIAVHPDVQRHGLGQGLMHCAMEYLASQRVSTVRLEVRPGNSAAIHLYEKMGFTIRGHTQDLQGPWLIMLKDMAANTST